MQGQIFNNIGEPGVTIASSCDSAADERLVVAAAKNGDELAFESLFKRYQRSIFALALRYTRGREDAEDVVQETFQKAFVHLQKFEGKSSLSTWLTRIAINQALMLLRSRRGQHELPIDDSSSHEATPALELADTSPDPEASYLQTEKTQSLSAAMRQLRPGMREAIELRELGELSNRDTAAHMGVSIGTVKARVFQARRKLAKTLRLHMRPPRICASDSRIITLVIARKIA
jgi:RNA polymerase sigma-70 factor (ECF subfamily)